MFEDADHSADSQPQTTFPASGAWTLTPQRIRFIRAAALVLVSPLVIDWPISELSRIGHFAISEMLKVFVMSIFLTKYCLMAVWLGWGGSRVVWRTIVVLSSIILGAFLFVPDPNVRGLSAMYILVIALMSVLIASPRLFGVAWIVLDDGEGRKSQNRERQFSLLDMFVWTLTAAIIAGVVRWLEMPKEFGRDDMWLFVVIVAAIYSLLPSIASLMAMWAVLPSRASLGVRIITTFAITMMLGVVILLLFSWGRAPAEMYFYTIAFGLFTMFWLILTFAVLRHLGHRLIRVPPASKLPTHFPLVLPEE